MWDCDCLLWSHGERQGYRTIHPTWPPLIAPKILETSQFSWLQEQGMLSTCRTAHNACELSAQPHKKGCAAPITACDAFRYLLIKSATQTWIASSHSNIFRWNYTKFQTVKGGKSPALGNAWCPEQPCCPLLGCLTYEQCLKAHLVPGISSKLEFWVDGSYLCFPLPPVGQTSLLALRQCCFGTCVYFPMENTPAEMVACQEGRDVKQHWDSANRGNASAKGYRMRNFWAGLSRLGPTDHISLMLLSTWCYFHSKSQFQTQLAHFNQKCCMQPPPHIFHIEPFHNTRSLLSIQTL